MRRIVVFLVAAGVFIVAAWLIYRLPGTVNAQFGPYSFAASSPVAVCAAIILFVVAYILVRIVAFLAFAPRNFRRWRAMRNCRLGDIAVTRTLVALAAGDTGDARREVRAGQTDAR